MCSGNLRNAKPKQNRSRVMGAGAPTFVSSTTACGTPTKPCFWKCRRITSRERSGKRLGTKKDIRVAHSPDSDDAFMFYALATHKIDTGDLNYIHLLSDIETLNRKALEGEYEVSAISFHAYAYMADKYALLYCGAWMGIKYCPIVVTG